MRQPKQSEKSSDRPGGKQDEDTQGSEEVSPFEDVSLFDAEIAAPINAAVQEPDLDDAPPDETAKEGEILTPDSLGEDDAEGDDI